MKQLKYKDIIEHLDNVLKFNCGKARCFLGYGVYDTVITWEKGERCFGLCIYNIYPKWKGSGR